MTRVPIMVAAGVGAFLGHQVAINHDLVALQAGLVAGLAAYACAWVAAQLV